MCLRCPAGLVHGFPAPLLVSLEIVVNRVSDGERPLPRVVAFLAPQLGPPPCPRCLLCLAIVENGHAVRVLQIIAGSDFVFGIATVLRPPSRQPRAALAPAAVRERPLH